MTERVETLGSSLPRWQIPELETATSAVAPAVADEPADCEAGSAEVPRNGADGVNGRTNGSAHDHAPTSEIVAAEILRGHAEGVARGLAEGREQGYAEGLAAAKAAEEKLAAQADRLTAIADRLAAPIPALERAVEESVAALALEVARCVVGGEVARSRDYLVRLIREAIAKVPIEMGALQLVLNPADVELIRELAPDVESGGAVLVGDAAVEAGGCLVVADGGGKPVKDRRWRPRAGEGISQVDLTLAARWRGVMLALFDGEEE
jgi:flagellar assembly protein FliH